MSKKYIYSFEESRSTPNTIMILGNKGAQLAEMTRMGLPVPGGFTITTEACIAYYENSGHIPAGLQQQVKEAIEKLEKKMKKNFGDPENPLLVSVRSGSYVSMPGMMDSVLNLGLNDVTVKGFSQQSRNERAAWDSYRRFIQMFGDVVMKVPHEAFEKILDERKKIRVVKNDTDLNIEDLQEIVESYKRLIKRKTDQSFPVDVNVQLEMAISAVFKSWHNPRAQKYRRIHNLRDDAGTAVNVQAMVFGNMGRDSGTGVGFTRNPSTGEREHYGEYLSNAQGEDVVAGIRTPQNIDALKKKNPKVFKQLVQIYNKLEKHYAEMQDFEFTIEKGKLYILQTRKGKRTAKAAIKIAVDMEKEGLISKKDAIMRVNPNQLDQLLHKQFTQNALSNAKSIGKGLAASPGAATGVVVFDADQVVEYDQSGKYSEMILVRTETSPEDIEGMNIAKGFLTSRGGLTSHAAVVGRGMGTPCIVGASGIVVNEKGKQLKVGSNVIKEGDWISIDGGSGEFYIGKLEADDPELPEDFKKLMEWADEVRKLKIRANADTEKDSKVSRDFGAEGIGLARTEHMFFEEGRILAVREMIVAKNSEERRNALAKILPMQKKDFKGIFKAMDGLPVTIRLLDPPLHEFLPKEEEEIKKIATEIGVSFNKLQETISRLHEFNPMLGLRGVRLGITHTEIVEMQARAIFEAALQCNEEGINAIPEIEVPLVGDVNELKTVKEVIERIAQETGAKGIIKYKIGTMVELPRACLTADQIAAEVEFISFGTNDLTQTTFGLSRDDAGGFLPKYVEQGVLKNDPFEIIDREGVGSLMKLGIEKALKANPSIEIGICGEHGGEPNSVEFCHELGMDYVSASPYRIPLARLAAAQAAIRTKAPKRKLSKKKVSS